MRKEVYDKTGTKVRCVVRKVQYSGTFMGECSVTTTLYSESPIEFETGDYFVYRGETFTINYDPSVMKRAGIWKSGEAYVYEDVKFNSNSDELARCDFLDYVLGDNFIHFSSLPTFSFFASGIQDLADRIQANLDRVYTDDRKWAVEVHPEYVDTANVNVDVNRIKVWGALELIKSKFNANFIIRGRKITIGTAGVAIDAVFERGKGKGLVEIQRVAESNQQIITRLRVYGSTRNLPVRYYNKLSDEADPLGTPYMPDNMAVQNLMLPDFPRHTLDAYIDSPNVAVLGIREDSVYFDGSDEALPEIYPSMEGMTAEQLTAAGIPCSIDTGDNGNLDEMAADATEKDGRPIRDDGIWEQLKEGQKPPPFLLTLKDVGFDINKYLTGETATISMRDGMCGGREFEITKCVKRWNKYVLTCERVCDDGLGLYFPYKDYPVRAGDKFTLLNIEMPEVYISAASQRLLKAGKEFLAKNDYTRYTYEVKLDEIYMARHPLLYGSLKEGDLMLFTESDFKVDGSIVIDSLRITEGEGIVPTYEVTLANEKSVGTIEKIQNAIDSIGGGQGPGGYNAQQINSLIRAFGGKLFLSKISEDKAQEILTFLKGLVSAGKIQADGGIEVKGGISADTLSSGKADFLTDVTAGGTVASLDLVVKALARTYDLTVERTADVMNGIIRGYISSDRFVSGLLGEGFKIWKDAAGLWRGELDSLTVRKVFAVFEMIVRRMTHQGGMVIRSVAGAKITEVADGGSHWKCAHDSPDTFAAGDQVLCQAFTGTGMKRWWRLVTSAGDGYFNLSKADCEPGSGAPEAGDEVAVLGNRSDPARRKAQVSCSVGADAPYRDDYDGIDSFSLQGRLVCRTGNLSGVIDPDFGALAGSGLYGKNVYLKGAFALRSGKTVEEAIGDVETRFEVREGEVSSKVTEAVDSAVRAKSSEDKAAGSAVGASAAATSAKGAADTAASTLAEITRKESGILQTAENISLSVAEVEAAAGRAEKAEASIDVKADGIVLQASNTAAKKAVDGMRTAIKRTEKWVDARDLDQSKYYPVTIGMARRIPMYTITLDIWLDDYNEGFGKPVWSTHPHGFCLVCKWTVNASGWGGIEVKRTVLDYAYKWTGDVVPAGNLWQMLGGSYEVVYVRGGSKYRIIVEGDADVPVVLRASGFSDRGYTAGILDSVEPPEVEWSLHPTEKEIRSAIKVSPGKITVFGQDIELTGAVTFNSLDDASRNIINKKLDTVTLIDGGFIRTSLIKSDSITADKIAVGTITADKIAANAITANEIDVSSVQTAVVTADRIAALEISTGKLTVRSGARVGSLKIMGDTLTNEPFDNDAEIIFRNDSEDTFAGIGGNVLPASTGLRAVGKFSSEKVRKYYEPNIALVVSARNGYRNRAIVAHGDILTDGLVTGYGLQEYTFPRDNVYQDVGDLNHGNLLYVYFNHANCGLVLPPLHTVQDSLGISRESVFSMRLTVICSESVAPGKIYGRTPLLAGRNTAYYPVLYDNDMNVKSSGWTVGRGDVMEVFLFYNGEYRAYTAAHV